MELEKLLNRCYNFIQPYNDGGNEAERLIEMIDKYELPTLFKVATEDSCVVLVEPSTP